MLVYAPYDREAGRRPCLVLAHPDAMYAAVASRYFRQCGWDVALAHSGPEARRLAMLLRPTVIVLEANLREESGWLTCEKLAWERPRQKVVLVAADTEAENKRYAAFVGASDLVNRRDGVTRLVDAVFGAALRAVG